jgi:hypothetical protein
VILGFPFELNGALQNLVRQETVNLQRNQSVVVKLLHAAGKLT